MLDAAGLTNWRGEVMNSLGEVVNNAMELVEQQSEQLSGVLPKGYTMFSDELLAELLRIFNNSALDEVGGDIVGRIYEYFLNKFAKNIAQDDGVFFTPKSLVKMIVNVLEPPRASCWTRPAAAAVCLSRPATLWSAPECWPTIPLPFTARKRWSTTPSCVS